ncbi:MAG: hypothetical protein LBL47_00810 [Lactobacillus sp.]|jgi:hypothetical protein|nr:hypothetical protein [Lactobacillus sp.]
MTNDNDYDLIDELPEKCSEAKYAHSTDEQKKARFDRYFKSNSQDFKGGVYSVVMVGDYFDFKYIMDEDKYHEVGGITRLESPQIKLSLVFDKEKLKKDRRENIALRVPPNLFESSELPDSKIGNLSVKYNKKFTLVKDKSFDIDRQSNVEAAKKQLLSLFTDLKTIRNDEILKKAYEFLDSDNPDLAFVPTEKEAVQIRDSVFDEKNKLIKKAKQETERNIIKNLTNSVAKSPENEQNLAIQVKVKNGGNSF